jgi:hypothetical protein
MSTCLIYRDGKIVCPRCGETNGSLYCGLCLQCCARDGQQWAMNTIASDQLSGTVNKGIPGERQTEKAEN